MKQNKKSVDFKLRKVSDGKNNDYAKINSSLNRVVKFINKDR